MKGMTRDVLGEPNKLVLINLRFIRSEAKPNFIKREGYRKTHFVMPVEFIGAKRVI